MARSVGEAGAMGLERGFRLAMDVTSQREQQRRNDALDAQRSEDRGLAQARAQRQDDRQAGADQAAALGQQEAMHNAELQGIADTGSAPPPDVQRALVARGRGLQDARGKLLAKTSGYDFDGAMRAGQVDLKSMIAAGDNVGSLTGEQIQRAVTVGTRQPHTKFLRGPNGEPSQAEADAQAMIGGLETGDVDQIVKGANGLYAPSLLAGVGEPSPHGGKVVGKQIVNLVPAPDSDPKDPRYIPVMRVFVSNCQGKKGAPFNASGYYDAPLTEDRSSRPDAKVKSIGMKDAMDYVGNNLQLVDLLNRDDVRAKMAEPSNFDSDQFVQELARRGIRKRLTKAEEVGLEEGAREAVRQPGRLEVARVKAEETRKTNDEKPASGSAGTMEAKLAAVDADAGLTEKQKAVERRAIRSGIKPGKYTGDGGGGGGGGGKGSSGAGLSKEERADIKEESDALDKKEQRVIALSKLNEPKEPKALGLIESQNENAVAAHRAKVGKYERDQRSHDQALKASLEKIGKEQDELTQRRQSRADARNPGLGDAKRPPAAAGKVMKFDRNGNLVDN